MRRHVWLLPELLAAGLFLATLPLSAQEVYQDEISIMKRAVAAFDYSAGLIEKASTVEEMTAALEGTADRLKLVIPDMAKVEKAHPDWGVEPPPEVGPAIKLFNTATNRFFDAIDRATKCVDECTEETVLKLDFGRVNKATK